jgi:hypothetical protein
MEKNLAFLVYPFCYLVSPIIAMMNNEGLEITNEKMWLKLNGYKEPVEI